MPNVYSGLSWAREEISASTRISTADQNLASRIFTIRRRCTARMLKFRASSCRRRETAAMVVNKGR